MARIETLMERQRKGSDADGDSGREGRRRMGRKRSVSNLLFWFGLGKGKGVSMKKFGKSCVLRLAFNAASSYLSNTKRKLDPFSYNSVWGAGADNDHLYVCFLQLLSRILLACTGFFRLNVSHLLSNCNKVRSYLVEMQRENAGRLKN